MGILCLEGYPAINILVKRYICFNTQSIVLFKVIEIVEDQKGC